MAKPNETPETTETTGTNGTWQPNKAVFNREMKAIQAAQEAADKAQETAEAAKAKVSELVIAFLEVHGKPAPVKDGKADGEPSYPEVDSQLFGGRVQPVIRNSETKDGKKSRTGFIKRFGAKSVPKF